MNPVRDNPDQGRYEITKDDQIVGFAEYKLTGARIAFTHTEVYLEFAGRGLARRLVTDALADVRDRGLAVLPFCPYVRSVIASDPAQYLDLVRAQDRARFELPEAANSTDSQTTHGDDVGGRS